MFGWTHYCLMSDQTMQAMVLEAARSPLRLTVLPIPEPSSRQLRLRVLACGVCRTDLHIVDGELTEPKLGSACHCRGGKFSHARWRSFEIGRRCPT